MEFSPLLSERIGAIGLRHRRTAGVIGVRLPVWPHAFIVPGFKSFFAKPINSGSAKGNNLNTLGNYLYDAISCLLRLRHAVVGRYPILGHDWRIAMTA